MVFVRNEFRNSSIVAMDGDFRESRQNSVCLPSYYQQGGIPTAVIVPAFFYVVYMESTAPKEKATFFPCRLFPLELWIPYRLLNKVTLAR